MDHPTLKQKPHKFQVASMSSVPPNYPPPVRLGGELSHIPNSHKAIKKKKTTGPSSPSRKCEV